MTTLNNSTFDVLFMNEKKGTQVIHINSGAGSCLEVSVPWVTKDQNGYVSKIKGQLLHMAASTCLNFRHLAEAESLEFDVSIKYPMVWNQHQEWIMNLTGYKGLRQHDLRPQDLFL